MRFLEGRDKEMDGKKMDPNPQIPQFGEGIRRTPPQKGEYSRGRARAQMKSVDFMLALIVFAILLTYLFMAVAGVTNTTFSATQQQTQEEAAYRIASQLIQSTGTPSSWNHNLEEFPEVFGLASSGIGGELDAGKIARIDPRLEHVGLKQCCPYLYIPYSVARERIPTISKEYHFSIELVGIIDIIPAITLRGAELELDTVVLSHNTTQKDATVWTYILDPGGEVLSHSESITNENGATPRIKLNLPRSGTYVIVTIAEKSAGYAYNYQTIDYNVIRALDILAFVQPHPQPGTGELLQYLTGKSEVISDQDHFIVKNANATVLFAGGSTETVLLNGEEHLRRGEITLRARGPQIIVTRAQVDLGQTSAYGVGITAIPLILANNRPHPTYNPLETEKELSVENIDTIRQLVIVQGIPMVITIKLWKGSV